MTGRAGGAGAEQPTQKRGWYRVEVQRPADEAGGYETVHVDDSAYGSSAVDAAAQVFRYGWPASLYASPRPSRRSVLASLPAGVRMVVTPRAFNPHGDSATLTLPELQLHLVKGAVRERREADEKLQKARADLAEARRAADTARSIARSARYVVEESVDLAAVLGVDEAAIRRATRAPRTPRNR